MMMGSGIKYFFLVSSILLLSIIGLVSCDDSLQNKCSPEFTKLTDCLDYSTGKADAPSSTCCTSISGIRASTPECLCFIIQQTYKGLPSAKQLGLQPSRLVQLPSACKLSNTTISDCPKLLKLSPSSPDSAIFTNATKAASTSSGPTTTPASDAVMHKVCFAAVFAAMVSAIFLSFYLFDA